MKQKYSSSLERKSFACEPPKGKTVLTIGQDLFSIQEYVLSQYNASLHRSSTRSIESFYPAATMFYTDLQNLKGINEPVDYGSGVEYAEGLVEAFHNSGIQIGLWLNGTLGCLDILAGKLDDHISQLYKTLNRLHSPKIFLRVGYEFDNPSFGYASNPAAYRQVFRRMVYACEEQLGYHRCHQKIAFCWHSWGASLADESSLLNFYPGDDVVDWVGVSIFQQVYPWINDPVDNNNDTDDTFTSGLSQSDLVVQVLEFAQKHNKPIMIAESTPFGGIFMEDDGPFMTSNDTQVPDIWETWFEPVLELIDTYDIGMWCYINCDWDSQPMWHNIGFGDTRLSSSAAVMKSWYDEVLQNPRFLTAYPSERKSRHEWLQCRHWSDQNYEVASIYKPSIMAESNIRKLATLSLPMMFVISLLIALSFALHFRFQNTPLAITATPAFHRKKKRRNKEAIRSATMSSFEVESKETDALLRANYGSLD